VRKKHIHRPSLLTNEDVINITVHYDGTWFTGGATLLIKEYVAQMMRTLVM